MRIGKTILLLAAALAVVSAPALAFHDGGVAHCDGCHSMHNSQDGAAYVNGKPNPGFGWDDLLLYENPSDVCLSCHGGARSYNVFTTDPLNPGLSNYYSAGNFVFLLEDNINDGHNGASNPIDGDGSGHNIKSSIKSSDWDQTLTAPPAGDPTITSNELHCSSCHDPHGNDGFRLLYQQGQDSTVGGQTVTYGDTMEAFGISFGAVETDSLHNAYVDGYSGWCNSCHKGFHQNSGRNIHPSGETLGATIAGRYNKYKGTADCVANPGSPCGTGVVGTSYLADVPFEDIGHTAASTTSTTGPGANSLVSCVTCHRAHATSARDAGRWDFQVTLLDEDGDESGSWPIPYTYNTPADTQRSLCNKCHTQDEFDHVP